ncbi:lmo0937 family membrane protein [Neisseriaceae bacterium JH1-16]|nr:lmo0937 family membrane protein [Neisseriaceae bacterium JH1-16]
MKGIDGRLERITLSRRKTNADVCTSVQTHSRLCAYATEMSIAQTVTGGDTMLETIIVILLVIWALGMLTSFTMGGAVHILLALAVIVLLFRFFQGRRV